MLINEQGQRIDKGPLSVVSDPKRPDRAVENGISCMTCHVQGLIVKKDQIRPHVEKNPASFSEAELQTIKALYVPDTKLESWFTKDNDHFRAAVRQTSGKVTITESITGLVGYFEQEVDLNAAAAELGMAPGELSDKLGESADLMRVLGPLRVPGGTVQRQVFTETFRAQVEQFRLGTYLGGK
jgi:hypothetical protein